MFRLLSDADVHAFIEADARAQMDFFYQQPGLARRTTSRNGDDWLVLTLWGSEADADACLAASSSDGAYEAFESFIDPTSVEVKRYFGLEG